MYMKIAHIKLHSRALQEQIANMVRYATKIYTLTADAHMTEKFFITFSTPEVVKIITSRNRIWLKVEVMLDRQLLSHSDVDQRNIKIHL